MHIVSSLKVGGMEHMVVRLAASQIREGHQAAILCLEAGKLAATARSKGVKVFDLTSRSKTIRLLKALLALKRFSPTVIHAHNVSSLHYAANANRFTGAPVVLTFHGNMRESNRNHGKAEWKAVSAVVAVSLLTAEQVRSRISLTESAFHVIYNGVDTESGLADRHLTRRMLGVEDRFVAVVVARIDGYKGHDTLLRAIAALPASSALTVLIVGDGPERRNLENMAGTLGINVDRVRFLGFRDDVSQLLDASDIFLLPSLSEGLPLSVLEAMAHSLPVVATPVGGLPELISPGTNGILVPVDDAFALSNAMSELETSPELRRKLGRAASDTVQEQFSLTAMVDAYNLLYGSMLAQP